MRTHKERVLVAGLGGLNADLSRYVLKVIEADHTGTPWPHDAQGEATLALRMVALAGQLEIHAKQLLRVEGDPSEPIVVNGEPGSGTSTPPCWAMTGALWLVALLGVGALFVGCWMLTEWRADIRQAKTAGRAAQGFLVEMGRHSLPEAEERTEPKYAEARALLPIGDEPAKRPRRIPVGELLARARDDGYALRLNWRHNDERAKHSDIGTDPSDFPTAVLPQIAE
jgi:hypothetical protein